MSAQEQFGKDESKLSIKAWGRRWSLKVEFGGNLAYVGWWARARDGAKQAWSMRMAKTSKKWASQKCTFFMRGWGAWLGFLAWWMSAWSGSIDAQEWVLQSPKTWAWMASSSDGGECMNFPLQEAFPLKLESKLIKWSENQHFTLKDSLL